MSVVRVALACLTIVLLVVPGVAAEAPRNIVVRVPTIAGYRDFWWGLVFQNAKRDLVLSYSYMIDGRMQTHYFDVDTLSDLDPSEAGEAANVPYAAGRIEAKLGLRAVAADVFHRLELPDGQIVEQYAMLQGRSCWWVYPLVASLRGRNGHGTDLALFVRSAQPRYVTLRHDCERSAGTDKVRLRFSQPLLEGIYSPRNEFFVRCNGGLYVPCSGPPRLMRVVTGGLDDILKEFHITAVPASVIMAAYKGLAEEGLSAQQAVDQAETAVMGKDSGTAHVP